MADSASGRSGHELSARQPRVLVWPKWLDNPYLPNLLGALQRQDIDAFTAQSLTVGSVRLREGDWLHLHWPGQVLACSNRRRQELRTAAFHSELKRLKRRGVRIAWTAHNLLPHDDLYPDLGLRARRDLLSLVDHVFLHFDGARAELETQFGYTGPTSVIGHPHYADDYPTPPSRDDARARLGLPQGGLVLLAFGMLRKYKNIDAVIRAFRDVPCDDSRLIIAGKPMGDVADDLALAAADPRVIVHPRAVPDAEVPVYFGAADAAVIAHRSFFTSGSAMLSLSMGCPIIGPPVHHLADLAGDNRLFPITADADGLRVALEHARVTAPNIDRAAIRAWALDQGSWDDMAMRTARVLRNPAVGSRRHL